MRIELTEVRRIASLAQLEFEEGEWPRLVDQLSAILTHMDCLSRAHTDEVEPMFHSLPHGTPLREDLPRSGLGADGATAGAPGGSPGQFLVPRVIG